MPGCAQLLKKYMLLLCEHVLTISETACSIIDEFGTTEESSDEKRKIFVQVSETVSKDAGCLLLHPLVRKCPRGLFTGI